MNENASNDTTLYIMLYRFPNGLQQWEIVNTKLEAEYHARVAMYRGATVVLTAFSDDKPFNMMELNDNAS